MCIGGDRASVYEFAKRQLLRAVDDTNPNPQLAELEYHLLQDTNNLDIGPMGFAGQFTLGCCKIGTLNRLPASYFVSITYMCWAYHRRGVVLDTDGKLTHGGNPVLWCKASKVFIEKDAAVNWKPSKKKSTERIDGIIALDRTTTSALPFKSLYQTRGALIF